MPGDNNGGLLNSLPVIGAGLGVVGDILGIFKGFHQDHLANKIHPVWQQYQTSPYAKQELGLAQQLFNGAMPGYQQQQQGIENSQANYLNNVDKNATDSSQALALGGLSQGQSNKDYSQLGVQNEQWKNGMLGNLNTAYQTMIGEGDKSFQSMLQKYMQDTQTQNALRANGTQNMIGGFNAAGSNLIAFGNYKKGG